MGFYFYFYFVGFNLKYICLYTERNRKLLENKTRFSGEYLFLTSQIGYCEAVKYLKVREYSN